MVMVVGGYESPLPTDMTLVFAALILMANRSAIISMHCSISTRFSGLVENKIIATLALSFRPRQEFARVPAKRESQESHLMLLEV